MCVCEGGEGRRYKRDCAVCLFYRGIRFFQVRTIRSTAEDAVNVNRYHGLVAKKRLGNLLRKSRDQVEFVNLLS